MGLTAEAHVPVIGGPSSVNRVFLTDPTVYCEFATFNEFPDSFHFLEGVRGFAFPMDLVSCSALRFSPSIHSKGATHNGHEEIY
jgi:hypothetical protein